ncbi:MAG: hypothetical protein Q9192_001092 [Flavoplaca navasiana]
MVVPRETILQDLRLELEHSDDLRRFHESHLGPIDSTVNVVPLACASNDANGVQSVEEDDLGYYPDGVKRTLTDEQIAMFRHSEIYALQRKRQLRKENQDVSDSLGDSPGNSTNKDIQHEQAGQASPISPEQSIDKFMKHYGPGGKNRCDFQAVEEAMIDVTDSTGPDRTERGSITRAKKRRKRNNDQKHSDHRDTTSRRRARELDDAVADVGILDYGAESSVMQSIETETERVNVDFADHDHLADLEIKHETVSPEKGRKIWWPTIG